MRKRISCGLMIVMLVWLAGYVKPRDAAARNPGEVPQPAAYPVRLGIPYELISEESLLGYLEYLTSIQPYSGWRNSASTGETEALEYVSSILEGFSNLDGSGMEIERQEFPVFLETEIWDAGMTLTVDGRQVQVPAE